MLRVFAVVALPLVVGACSAEPRTTRYVTKAGATFGQAVEHNMSAHIIDPTPADPTVEVGADGRRARIAIERYRTDKVEPPATTAVSGIGPAAGGDSEE